MLLRWGTAAAATAAVVGAALACTGSEPDLVSSPPDGGGPDQATAPADANGATDAPVDAGPRCRREDPFGVPSLLDGVNDGVTHVVHPRLTPDELEIFYQRNAMLYTAQRAAKNLPFQQARPIPTLADASVTARDPSISSDSLVLYLALGDAPSRLAKMTRATRSAGFGAPGAVDLTPEGSSDSDPHLLGNDQALWLVSLLPDAGGRRVMRAATDGDGGFRTAEVIPILNGGRYTNPAVSDDELDLYLATDAVDDMRVFRATRTTTSAPFGDPLPVAELNALDDGGSSPRPGWMSPDDCRMYSAADLPGTTTAQLWIAERTPR